MSTTSTARLIRPVGSTGDVQQSRSGPLLAVWLDKLSLWLERKWQRDELRHRIDDKRLLDDIGLTRQQVLNEANKPFGAERAAYLGTDARPYSSWRN